MDNKHTTSITDEPVYGMSRAWLGGALNTARRIIRELQEKAEGLEAKLEAANQERESLKADVAELRALDEEASEGARLMMANAENLEKEFEEAKAERDALAAHVELLRAAAFEVCNDECGGSERLIPQAIYQAMMESTGDRGKYPDPIDALARAALSTSKTSLAHRDKLAAADILVSLAAEQEQTNRESPKHAKCYQLWRDIPIKLRDYAYRLRSEAERGEA